jgi:uncharacterized damage-inducible protein DinB
MSHDRLVAEYLAGPQLLRDAIAGMTSEQIDAAPIPGKWSTRQVICHIADFEPVYADRMKRVIAEDQPLLMSGDPDLFATKLAYDQRDIENELRLIEIVRQQMATILRAVPAETFQRTGKHSTDGPLTIETLLTRITGHIPHHVQTIIQKRAVLD